jgi:hypothetical protein
MSMVVPLRLGITINVMRKASSIITNGEPYLMRLDGDSSSN